jgi:hypothetical protein
MVHCNTCGLVRSDPVADPATVAGLYRQSTFDYSEEVANLKRTYGVYLMRLEAHKVNKGCCEKLDVATASFWKRIEREVIARLAALSRVRTP